MGGGGGGGGEASAGGDGERELGGTSTLPRLAEEADCGFLIAPGKCL